MQWLKWAGTQGNAVPGPSKMVSSVPGPHTHDFSLGTHVPLRSSSNVQLFWSRFPAKRRYVEGKLPVPGAPYYVKFTTYLMPAQWLLIIYWACFCHADFDLRSAQRVIGVPHCFQGASSISAVSGPQFYTLTTEYLYLYLYVDERRSSCFKCSYPVARTCQVCFDGVCGRCFDGMLRKSIPVRHHSLAEERSTNATCISWQRQF